MLQPAFDLRGAILPSVTAVLDASSMPCRNRFIETADGEPGLNYLCVGYKSFFTHIEAPMNTMTRLLGAGRPASEVMTADAASHKGIAEASQAA